MPSSKALKPFMRSVNNIVVLSMCVIGMYFLYRYIKALDNDISVLRTRVDTIACSQSQLADSVTVGGLRAPSPMLHDPTPHHVNVVVNEEARSEISSIPSNELTDMLRAVLSGDEDAICPPPIGIFMSNMQEAMGEQKAVIRELSDEESCAEDESVVHPIEDSGPAPVPELDLEGLVPEGLVPEGLVPEGLVPEDPEGLESAEVEVVRSMPDDADVRKILARKTNEELRAIIRQRDGSAPSKGSKTDLIAHIMGAGTVASA